MATQKLKKIIEETMKNMEISSDSDANFSETKKKLQPGASVSTLRDKYLSLDQDESADSAGKKSSKKSAKIDLKDDVEVEIIKKKLTDNDASSSSEKRTIIGSKDKGILGSQG